MMGKQFSLKKFGISNIEFAIFSLVLVFSYFSFQHPDLILPGGSSIAILKGHFFDFYEYNKPLFIQNNYLISTYLIYALWNIPVVIFNPEIDVLNPGAWIFWYKGLTAIFYFLNAIQLRKMALKLGLSSQNAVLAVLFWVSCPIAFFSNFIFGQNDVFTMFFMLVAINMLIDRRVFWFTFYISISITFKYFPIFIYIPLLLAVEKNLWRITKNMILLFIPMLIEVAIFIGSPAFFEGVFGFSVAHNFFAFGLFNIDIISINPYILFWTIIVLYSYFILNEKLNNLNNNLIYLVLTILIGFFFFSYWHPQWMILITPFAVLTTMLHKNRKLFWIIDVFKMLFFVAFVVTKWPQNVDSFLLNLGVLPGSISVGGSNLLMSDIFILGKHEVFLSLFLGTLVFELLLKNPGLAKLELVQPIINERKLLMIRFILGISIFVIPALISFYM